MFSKKNSHYKPRIGNHLSNLFGGPRVEASNLCLAKLRKNKELSRFTKSRTWSEGVAGRSYRSQGTWKSHWDQAATGQTVLPHQWQASYPTQPKGRKGWSQTLSVGHFGQIRQGRRIANICKWDWGLMVSLQINFPLIWIPASNSLSLLCTCFIPNVPIASDSQCAAGKIPDWQRTAHTWKHGSERRQSLISHLWLYQLRHLVRQHPSSTCKVSHQRRQFHARGSKEGERATKTLANHRIPIPDPHPVHLVHWACDAYSCAPTRSSQDWCVARPAAPCTENKFGWILNDFAAVFSFHVEGMVFFALEFFSSLLWRFMLLDLSHFLLGDGFCQCFLVLPELHWIFWCVLI